MKPVDLTIHVPFPTMTFTPVYVAQEAGFFERYKLNVELTHKTQHEDYFELIDTDGPVVTMLLSYAIRAAVRGSRPRLITQIFDQVVHRLVGQPEIETPADMKGKTIMVNAFGGTSDLETRFVLRQNDIVPGRDVTLVEAGPGLEVAQVEALERGEVDVIASSNPYWYECQKKGYKLIADAGDTYGNWLAVGLVVNADWADREPDVVNRLTSAMQDTSDYIRSNREDTADIILKYVTHSDRETLLELYDELGDAWPATVKHDSLQNFVELYCDVNQLPPLDYRTLLDN